VTAHDLVPYINSPYAQTHPSRLFVLGKLAGLDPAPIETCRVLEMGASEGVNLIGMAVVLPSARFLGIDLAEKPVERGRRAIEDLRLNNVRLEHMDLLEFDSASEEFDYIIAHGVYAWTPPAVRDRVLALIHDLLTPHGVAFVSYNTKPAGYLRQMVREMMLFATRGAEDPQEKLEKARAWLRVIAAGKHPATSTRAKELLERTDSALLHDDLADGYEPVYFHEFAEHAASHRLQYLSDANPLDQAPRDVTNQEREAILRHAAADRIAEQQLLDFVRMRQFRQSLLCHESISLKLEWNAAAARGLHATSLAREEPNGAFVSPAGARMTTPHPAPVSYLRRLIAAAPQAEIVSAEDAPLAVQLFGAGLIELHAFPGIAVQAGETPTASPWARYQVGRGDLHLNNLWHRPVELVGEPMRRLFRLLDGTTDRNSLANAMQCSTEDLDKELDWLGHHALLIA
jgi:SAM-dependent methyltransferase